MRTRALEAGTRFGRYVIERVQGRGTFGVVYAARRDDLPRTVALKVLHRELTQNHDVVARFHAEARAIAELRHPHIVDINDLGTVEGGPFIAMELLQGETLRDRLERENVLALDVTVDLLLPIFSAVAAVHARGFVHRDIKPDNIMLAEILPGRVHPKLLDFGVAKVSGQGEAGMTRTGAAVGTPYYMSPEQAEEAREADASSDQWSLAVLVYRCITGVYPFDGRSVVKILHSIIEDTPALPSTHLETCPAVVERALMRALSKSPRNRFPNVRAFAAVLLPFASRRAREEWRDELVDTTARTNDLAAPPATPLRAMTQSGPTFQAMMLAAPKTSEMYDDELRTDVAIPPLDGHDTLPAGLPSMMSGSEPILPIAPAAPITTVYKAARGVPANAAAKVGGIPAVAVPPPPVPSTSVRPSLAAPDRGGAPRSEPPAPRPLVAQRSDSQAPPPDGLLAGRIVASDPSGAEPRGTLSIGAHSMSPLEEARQSRRRILAAGLLASVSVFASASVYLKTHSGRRGPAVTQSDVDAPSSADRRGRLPDDSGVISALADSAMVNDSGALDDVESAPTRPDVARSEHHRAASHPGRTSIAATDVPVVTASPTETRASVPPVPEALQGESAQAEEDALPLPERPPQARVRAILASASRSIERCAGGSSGLITARIVITSEGVPGVVTVVGSQNNFESLQPCFVEVIRRLRFPPSQVGITIGYPYQINAPAPRPPAQLPRE